MYGDHETGNLCMCTRDSDFSSVLLLRYNPGQASRSLSFTEARPVLHIIVYLNSRNPRPASVEDDDRGDDKQFEYH
jgi:hypothetical protein